MPYAVGKGLGYATGAINILVQQATLAGPLKNLVSGIREANQKSGQRKSIDSKAQ